MFAYVLFVCVLCYFIKLFVNKKYSYWKDQNVPCLEVTFPFGNVGKPFLVRDTLSNFINSLYRDFHDYSYVGFYNFLTPAMVLRDPEVINDVLIKNFDNFHDSIVRLPDPITSINPFYTTGDTWKSLRKEFTPHISNLKLKQMLPLIETVCKNMVKYIKEFKGQSLNSLDLGYRFTGDNVVSCAYGLEGKSFTEKFSIMLQIQSDMTINNKIESLFSHTVGFFLPNVAKILKISYLGKYAPQSLRDTIETAIKCRKESKVSANDFLNFLMELKDTRKDLSYLGHACNFYLDAFDTSGLAFSYALYELSRNPHVQEEAQAEMKEVLSKHQSLYTSDAQKDLTCVEYILFETLRKHPIIKFLNRECTKSFNLVPPRQTSTKEVHIPKGTQIFVPIEAIHMDPNYFPNPEIFDPRRFTPENVKTRPKQVFLGFGDGPRICLGRPFGITQLKMGLTAILSNFKLQLSEETQFPLGESFNHISKLPKNTILIKFVPKEL